MALMPQPLSWGERMELAQKLRREADEKIKEAERIEKGLEDDQNKVWEAIQKMKRESTPNAKVSRGETTPEETDADSTSARPTC